MWYNPEQVNATADKPNQVIALPIAKSHTRNKHDKETP
jgi:hypothetical protein